MGSGGSGARVVNRYSKFAKNGDIGLRAHNHLELRQGGDSAPAQELAQRLRGEGDGAHNAIVPPCSRVYRTNYSIILLEFGYGSSRGFKRPDWSYWPSSHCLETSACNLVRTDICQHRLFYLFAVPKRLSA